MKSLILALALAAADPEVLDLEGAAALLRLTPAEVRAAAEAQRIPARRIGDEWRFSRPALVEWLKGGAGSPAAVVGEPRTRPTADEIALRDQGVLLGRGAATLDFGIAYTHSEEAPLPGTRVEQRALGVNAALRYGVLEDLQLTLRLPYVSRRTHIFTDASVSGSTQPATTSDDFGGDASLSLLWVAARERVGRPNVILSLDAVFPTGAGDQGLGGGVVFSKSYDPAVLFAGVSYLHGMDTDPADPRRALAEHNFSLNLGYTYALNDSLALSTVLSGTYRDTRSADGVAIPPPRERYQLQLGTTWALGRSLFLEPQVLIRLGGEGPDFGFVLNVPYSF